MADLSINLAGIKSPNPFWVASGPPSNTAYQAHRAFEAGWGGVVWKTIGDPIVNISSRYSALNLGTVAHGGLQQHRAYQRPLARDQLPRDRRGQAALAGPRRSSPR